MCGLLGVARAEGGSTTNGPRAVIRPVPLRHPPRLSRFAYVLLRTMVGAREKAEHIVALTEVQSATITCLTFNSYPVPNCGTQKFLRKTGQVTAVTVGAPVAALAAKTERRRVVFKVVSSRSMHWPSALASGATGEAVLTLEMHSREPYGHALRPRPTAAECSAATLAAKTE